MKRTCIAPLRQLAPSAAHADARPVGDRASPHEQQAKANALYAEGNAAVRAAGARARRSRSTRPRSRCGITR